LDIGLYRHHEDGDTEGSMLEIRASGRQYPGSERARAQWFPAPFPTMKTLLFSGSGNDPMLAIGTDRIAPTELERMNSAEPA
jgi:hypothetical protein